MAFYSRDTAATNQAYWTFTKTFTSINEWSCVYWILPNLVPAEGGKLSLPYAQPLASRTSGVVGPMISDGASNRFAPGWDGSEFSYNNGIDVPLQEWIMVGQSVSTAASVLNLFVGSPRRGTFFAAAKTGAITAKSPSAWFIGCDGFDAVGRRFSGAIAHVAMSAAFWPEGAFRKLARGAPIRETVNPQFYTRMDARVVDEIGGVPITTVGTLVRAPSEPPVAVRLYFPGERYDSDTVAGGGTVTGDGSAAGVGAAVGVGAATAAAAAASTGTGTALGVGSFTMAATQGVGNAAGTGTAAGVGAATVAATAFAAGLGTALGAGASIGIISAVGNAAGTSVALGYSPQLLGGGEAGRGAKSGARRKRITWLPADYDIETGEPRVPLAAEPAQTQPPSVQLTKGERKVARLLAQYRGRDDDVAERARAQLEALRAAEDGALARFIARQQALDVQRRAAAAIAAEDDDAVVAFMRWMMSQ